MLSVQWYWTNIYANFSIPPKISCDKILSYYTIRWHNRRLCLSFLTSSLTEQCWDIGYLPFCPLSPIWWSIIAPWYKFEDYLEYVTTWNNKETPIQTNTFPLGLTSHNFTLNSEFLFYFDNSLCPFVRPSWHFFSPIDFPPFFLSTDQVFLNLQTFASPWFSFFLLHWIDICPYSSTRQAFFLFQVFSSFPSPFFFSIHIFYMVYMDYMVYMVCIVYIVYIVYKVQIYMV